MVLSRMVFPSIWNVIRNERLARASQILSVPWIFFVLSPGCLGFSAKRVTALRAWALSGSVSR